MTQLACELEEAPMGRLVKTDAMQATSIPGIFACGDVARAAGSAIFAVADGAMTTLSSEEGRDANRKRQDDSGRTLQSC